MKRLFIVVGLSIIGVIFLIGIYIYSLNSFDRGVLTRDFWGLYQNINDSLKTKILDINTSDSCKKTGGKWEIETCGSACWDGYPTTKSERITNETKPYEPQMCIMMCAQNKYCSCPDGKYFGSIEEGCIPLSERREPTKEEQKNMKNF